MQPRFRFFKISIVLSGILFTNLSAGTEQHPRLRIGDIMPDLSLPKVPHGVLQLKSLRGNILAISFYSKYCAPCQRELPMLEQMVNRANEHRPQHSAKIVLVVVVIDDTNTLEAMTITAASYQQFILHDTSGKAREAFDPQKYPCTFLVDEFGKVRNINRGFGEGYATRVEHWLNVLVNLSHQN